MTTIQNTRAPLYEITHEDHIHLREISDPRIQNLCPVCHLSYLKAFIEISDVPIYCNTPWPSRNAAKHCPKGNVKLSFCPTCSFIMNLDFEPSHLEYTQTYGNPLHFSPYFQDYAQLLAKRLIKQYNLNNKDIIEIGCGEGYFLKLLCQLGNNRGIGFDPAHVERKEPSKPEEQVKFIQNYYSERYSDYQADFIICRQTLEHIPNSTKFLKMLRRIIRNREDTHLIFEVPNSTKIFREMFIWDIIYEHCSYFTSPSLAKTFSASGFHVSELTQNFEDQFLLIHAQPNDQSTPPPNLEQESETNKIAKDIESFATNYQNKVEKFRHKLKKLEDRGQRTVIWGAGSKGVTFLNILKNLQIEYVVDINPNKQGMHIPGTGQKIIPPEFLREYQPDHIIVMNYIYRGEIQQLIKKLGLTPKLISV
jgi:2-polyprenyl-3-methyl-5-hydroxy-6-metoxy-1,4-benzoquinol methylase